VQAVEVLRCLDGINGAGIAKGLLLGQFAEVAMSTARRIQGVAILPHALQSNKDKDTFRWRELAMVKVKFSANARFRGREVGLGIPRLQCHMLASSDPFYDP